MRLRVDDAQALSFSAHRIDFLRAFAYNIAESGNDVIFLHAVNTLHSVNAYHE